MILIFPGKWVEFYAPTRHNTAHFKGGLDFFGKTPTKFGTFSRLFLSTYVHFREDFPGPAKCKLKNSRLAADTHPDCIGAARRRGWRRHRTGETQTSRCVGPRPHSWRTGGRWRARRASDAEGSAAGRRTAPTRRRRTRRSSCPASTASATCWTDRTRACRSTAGTPTSQHHHRHISGPLSLDILCGPGLCSQKVTATRRTHFHHLQAYSAWHPQ